MIDIFDLTSQSIERQCTFLANSVLKSGEASFFLSSMNRPLRGHVNFTFLSFSNNEKSNSKSTSIGLSANLARQHKKFLRTKCQHRTL